MTGGNTGAIHPQHGCMAPSPSPEHTTSYTDYADRPLKVGDRVTYIWTLSNRPVLGTATIVLLTRAEACLDNGDARMGTLKIFQGDEIKATRGKPERYRFDQLALRPETPNGETDETSREEVLATLARVRALPHQPEAMDLSNPHHADYLIGYRNAINCVRRAIDNPHAEAPEARP